MRFNCEFVEKSSNSVGTNAAKPLMFRSARVAFAVIAGSLPSFACDNCLDPKMHRLCLDATDYPRCIEKMKGDAAVAAEQVQDASR